MSLPVTRDTFKEHCLQNLGKGAVTVNVTDAQVENRIDQAIHYVQEFMDYGSERIYHFHTITATDVTNRYITVPDTVFTVNDVVSLNTSTTGGVGGLAGDPMFTFGYQFRQRELLNVGSITLSYFYMMQMYRQEISNMFLVRPRIEYVRHANRIDIYADWGNVDGFKEDDVIVIDGFGIIDPDEYPKLYSSLPLIELATAMIKLQWGQNVQKYGQVQLPGGIMLNGEELYQTAKDEVAAVKDDIMNKYSAPARFMIG